MFRIGGTRLALDVESGSLHSLDEAAFSVLEKMGSPPEVWDESDPIMAELRALHEAGQLFTPGAEAQIYKHMEGRTPVIKALCLHMAHTCNLSCVYCFAGQGRYGEDDGGLMSLETGRKALDLLIDQSGSRKNLEVDFFGGEPMLNFDVVRELVAYGRGREKEAGKHFRFTLTTNGALLDGDNIPFINETFDNIVLSLDGRPETNDRMRGAGTYEKLLPKIKALSEARGKRSHYVRGTFTRHNLDFAADVLHLADAGFNYISVEPVVGPQRSFGADVPYALGEADLPALFAEYEKLADALLAREHEGRAVGFFHFDIDLEGGPCIAKRVTGCGAGSEYLAVTPSGRLFPCHQFVGEGDFCLGDVDSGVTDTEKIKAFSQCHVAAKPACTACWAKYYCGGGCMATAHCTNGDIMEPDRVSCALMKKRIECALYMMAKRKLNTHTVGE